MPDVASYRGRAMGDRMRDRVVVVTGGARGIGRGICSVFVSEGARLVVVDRDSGAGEKLAEGIRRAGGDAFFLEADVSVQADTERVAAITVTHFGRLDVLISNAGIFPSARLEEMTEADWDGVHDVNLKGLFLMVKAVMPQMVKQRYGRIVATSSITGNVTGYPGWVHYGATKAGVNGFIRTAAIELAPHNVTINCVEPGSIMTDGMARLGEDYIRRTEACIPMGKLGEPEDVAYAMLFLASDEAGYITGQSIVVDGGQTLPESALPT